MRLFVAVEVTGEAHERLLEVRTQLVEAVTRQGVRFVRPYKLHLTLSFLGHVEDEKVADLRQTLSGVEAATCSLEIGRLGGFPDLNRPKVIWLGVDGDLERLQDLVERVREASAPFAERQEDQEYHPHITLARVSPGSREVGRAVQALAQPDGSAQWEVAELVLFHSRTDGTYEALHRVPLC